MIPRLLPILPLIPGLLAARDGDGPLTVDDVVNSVRQHYPPLLAALLEQDSAAGEALTAEGRFDTTLRTRVDSDSFGYYGNQRLDIWWEQGLAWQGMSVYGGHRVSNGDFATYDGKLTTRSLGEVRAGVKLPLLRDRAIDGRRGELSKARIGVQVARLSVDQQKLATLRAAIAGYWAWVAAGLRLAVTRDVLQTAEARQKLLEEAVREGQIPEIDAIDNRRAILQRQSALVEADRAFQQVAIELSLFMRDSTGRPLIASAERVPARFPDLVSPESIRLDEGTRSALSRRPELARMDAQLDQAGIDIRLARNAAKPAVDVVAGLTAEGGNNPAVQRGPRELKAGLTFEFPWQNRSAKGRQVVAEARQKQLAVRSDFLRDQITAEVRDAWVWIKTAHERVRILGDEVRVSRDLEAAERARFELGEGTLFVLNLREQATLDAAIREASAQAEYQRALLAYDYASGALLDR